MLLFAVNSSSHIYFEPSRDFNCRNTSKTLFTWWYALIGSGNADNTLSIMIINTWISKRCQSIFVEFNRTAEMVVLYISLAFLLKSVADILHNWSGLWFLQQCLKMYTALLRHTRVMNQKECNSCPAATH